MAAGRAARAALLAPDKGARIGELYAMRDHLEGARTETEKLHVLMADPDGKEMVSNALGAIAAYAAALETYATQLEAAGLDIDSLQTLARHEMTLSQATTPVDLTRARDGSVMSAMETMRVALSDAVGRVHASSDSIATGAHQIAVGNTDLARRTEAQVASLTQTAAAMEQLSSTVVSNADVSRQAAQMALTARQSAERGGDVGRAGIDRPGGVCATRVCAHGSAPVDGNPWWLSTGSGIVFGVTICYHRKPVADNKRARQYHVRSPLFCLPRWRATRFPVQLRLPTHS